MSVKLQCTLNRRFYFKMKSGNKAFTELNNKEDKDTFTHNKPKGNPHTTANLYLFNLAKSLNYTLSE